MVKSIILILIIGWMKMFYPNFLHEVNGLEISEEIWLTIEEVCSLTGDKKETVRRKCKSNKYNANFEKNGKFKLYKIALSSLEKDAQDKYLVKNKNKKENNAVPPINTFEDYSNAPNWAKKQADKYIELCKLTDKLNYKEKLLVLDEWNANNPEKTVAYSTLMEAKRKYVAGGISALLAKYGHKNNKVIIKDEYFKYYKDLYLNEGRPSAYSCWLITLGYAKTLEEIDTLKFPSYKAFDRQLKKAVPEQGIYLARYGNSAWYKKYASYIPRDYTNLLAGSCWVSDHAQIDVAVNFNGSVCFPWVTVFRDIKTSKWLGWFLHADSPNSDHIFQAFYYGVQKFGLPNDIYRE